jgi:VacB/RNase II family 3'-5' exoribonuclease
MPGLDALERSVLDEVARQAMLDYGFTPDFPAEAQQEAAASSDAAPSAAGGIRDLRDLPWSSIDNRESHDLDQIEVLVRDPGGTRLYVGISDVSASVPQGAAIDGRARANTTSVYTGVHVYPMLPDRLSSGLTSLLPSELRRALVIEMLIDAAGELGDAAVYPALVVNHAKLNYPEVSAWLEGGAVPKEIAGSSELQQQIRDQDALASRLAAARKRAGAIDLDTAETRPVIDEHGAVTGLDAHTQDRAGALIEELMVAANRAVIKGLDAADRPSILRVVRPPERWDEIVAYAADRKVTLPAQPDSLAVAQFVDRMRAERPTEIREISLALIKLMGRGEYVAHRPGDPLIGHFGLAAGEYGHATAPNRRYADLVTQRLIGRAAAGDEPYSFEDLKAIAERCSLMESQAQKVERRVKKSIGAALVSDRIGDTFQGVITKVTDRQAFIRVFHPPLEGMVINGFAGRRVGDSVTARLASVDVKQSFIDFTM